MSYKTKAINATCEGGKVFVDGVEVPHAVILSAGQKKSQGCAIFSASDVFYVCVPVETLKELINIVVKMTDKLSSGVLASNGGGNITSPTFSEDLSALKTELNNLKGAMQ